MHQQEMPQIEIFEKLTNILKNSFQAHQFLPGVMQSHEAIFGHPKEFEAKPCGHGLRQKIGTVAGQGATDINKV